MMNDRFNSKLKTVDEITQILKETIFAAPELQNINVVGELLGFKLHSSGHAYFTLLGEKTRISCVLFRSNAASIITWPQDGDEVLVSGRMDVYGVRGSYQIYAIKLLPVGAGAKARAKKILKEKLEKEGIFSPDSKLPIPRFPRKIAVITSPTGAALQDFLKISSNRFPSSELVIIPSLMQGIDAEAEIIKSLNKCRSILDLSSIVLIRGGGNRDDLDVFDSEEIVRAIHLSPLPVITGLGHQIDSTLSDLAADLSSPTPSGVAEQIFPDSKDVLSLLHNSKKRMFSSFMLVLETISANLNHINERFVFYLIKGHINPIDDFLRNSYANMMTLMEHEIQKHQIKLDSFKALLDSLSPNNILSKGYCICKDAQGNILKDFNLLEPGDKLYFEFQKAILETTLNKITMKSKET